MYPFNEIEPKWQRYWEERKLFRAVDGDTKRQKLYVLDMFPYPSGAGLHVGHPEGYTATDIYCRFKRMQGYNILHPMGWDAFGLPAEQYAIETGTHPAETTKRNIETFRKQITRFGFSYDWDREVNTTDPAYVKWTQWIFLKLYERGLAYMAAAPVWWCPGCGTVLANEEVVDGACERKGHPVERKPMKQWMLKITAYADRLLQDLERLDWPEHIKEMQRHWIGKSEGAEVWFGLELPAGRVPKSVVDGQRVRERGGKLEFKVFTTRADTLFGATYVVFSPEHPLVEALTTDHYRGLVQSYRAEAGRKSELERTELAKTKSGVFTGSHAINPVNGQQIPIWIADYVLASYGTGAIMAVPAHDQRDLAFALQYGLDIRIVIDRPGEPLDLIGMTEAYADEGVMKESGAFTGLPSAEGRAKITAWLKEQGVGQGSIQYKLRDWLFSRQRYWGEPIPIVHCAKCGTVPLPESALPLTLPPMKDFQPTGTAEPPLAKAKEWVKTSCPKCRGQAQRETNTMPQWAGSCWYYLRYLDPHNNRQAWSPDKERYWMPVDLYVGGAEHAVLHLLYSRFWHKVLYDFQLVSTLEPFIKLINQGLILGEDGEKMSKSRGNVVNPDEIIDAHGADAFRLYEMFMGPLEAVKPWNTRSIEGIDRFLQRVWKIAESAMSSQQSAISASTRPRRASLSTDPERAKRVEGSALSTKNPDLERKLHQTIKKVTEDLEGLRFNTAIAQMMTFLNDLTAAPQVPKRVVETLVLLLAPFAPHVGEELWHRLGPHHEASQGVPSEVEATLGHQESLAYEPWPRYDAALLQSTEIQWIIQVNGKLRAKIVLPANIEGDELRQKVLADLAVRKWTEGKTVRDVIVVPKKLVNVVV